MHCEEEKRNEKLYRNQCCFKLLMFFKEVAINFSNSVTMSFGTLDPFHHFLCNQVEYYEFNIS